MEVCSASLLCRRAADGSVQCNVLMCGAGVFFACHESRVRSHAALALQGSTTGFAVVRGVAQKESRWRYHEG